MSQLPQTTLPSHRCAAFARLAKVLAALVIILGTSVFLGWQLDITVLKRIRPDFAAMSRITALAFVAAGIALWLADGRGGKIRSALQLFCSVLTSAIGALVLVKYLTGWNLHFAGFLRSTEPNARMALLTALSFFLLGAALAIMRHPRLVVLAQALPVLTAILSLLPLNGYLYGRESFPGVADYAAMALHAAAGLLLLSLGALLSSPNRGPVQSIASLAPGGVMAVRLLPCALLIPSILGWLCGQGQLHRFYDAAFGLALFTTANAFCFGFLIWSTALMLNRLDLSRSRAFSEIRLLNETLEARVASRTVELRESDQRFRSIIDAVEDYSIITLDAAGNVATWNSGAERQRGYKAEEILGKHVSLFYSPEQRAAGVPEHELLAAKTAGEYHREGWRVRKNGERFWAEALITAARNDDGTLRGFSKFTRDVTERKRAEERFALVVEASPTAIIMVGPNGLIQLVNDRTVKLFGYNRAELLGQPIEMLVPQRFRGGHCSHRADFFAAPSARPMGSGRDLVGLRKDGVEVPVEIYLNPMTTLDGTSVLASIFDITERKKVEKTLRDQALMLDLANDAVFIRDSHDRITYWNQGAQRLYGWSKEEALGQITHSLFNTQFPQPLNDIKAQLSSEGRWRGELLHTRRDGSLVTVVSAWTLQRDASNGLTSVLEMSYDITERKQAENQLRLVARRLKLATQALQAGVWELDLSTNLVDWDEKMYSIYGLPRDRRITYQTWADAVLPQDLPEAEAILQRALVSKTEIATEFRILHPDGSVRHIQAAHGVMLNDAAQVTRMVGVNIDITDQRRTDATLLEARHLLELRFAELAEINRQLALKNEEVEAFVYIVSHDLRAPLVNLKGFCKELELSCHELRQELIVAGADEDRVQTILNVDIPDSLHYINASTSTFHRLINSLLELSRYGRQEYNSEELDLNHLVQSTLDLLRLSIAAAGAQVSLGPIPKVYGDATAIGQVFANLIGNAVKYLQPGRPGLIVIGGELANGMAHCWVKDNGAGLPSSAKPRLFQVFQRFHPELAQGEGMGLAIVRRVVERHGGRIWAEGEEDGVGTAFHFTLPSGPRI